MDSYFVNLDLFLLVCVLAAGLVIRPSTNVLELRYVFVAAMTLGFCGEAMIELAGFEQLGNRLIVPSQAPAVYRYLAACAFAFWVGYHATRWRYVPSPPGAGGVPRIGTPSVRVLVILATIPVVLEAIDYGVDIYFGTDDLERGVLVQSGGTGDVHYARILSRIVIVPLSVVAGAAWQQRKRASYWAVPLLLCLPLVAQFSRGMFIPLVAFLFGASLVTTGARRLKYIPPAVALVGLSFVTGIAMRHYAPTTGLGRFAEVLTEESAVEPAPAGRGFDTPLRSLVHATTALPRATLAFEIGPRAEGHMKVGYVLLQLPIPSFLLPQASVPETSLTMDLGIKRAGNRGAGFPYPLVAEMKVFLGWFGCLIYLLLGWAVAKIDSVLNDPVRLRLDPYLFALLYGLLLNFIIRSFHSGLRPSLRPIMYFGALWLVLWLVRKPRARPTPV